MTRRNVKVCHKCKHSDRATEYTGKNSLFCGVTGTQLKIGEFKRRPRHKIKINKYFFLPEKCPYMLEHLFAKQTNDKKSAVKIYRKCTELL